MPRLLRPGQVLPSKRQRKGLYPLPPTVEQLTARETAKITHVRDFRIPLEGHVPGTPLPPLDKDPRLKPYVKKSRLRIRAPDVPKHILREGMRNPLGARLPALLPDEDSETAQKIWLPNLRIFLLRNGPNHAGDPYTATFRVPRQLNKVDIVQYLRQVYGIGVNGIRTVVQYGNLIKQPGKFKSVVREPILKKAIVQLNEPFLYPPEHNPYFLQEHFKHPLYGMRTKSAAIISPAEDMSYPAFKERQGRDRRKREEDIIQRIRMQRSASPQTLVASADEEVDPIPADEAHQALPSPELRRTTDPPWYRRLPPFDRSKVPRAHQPPR